MARKAPRTKPIILSIVSIATILAIVVVVYIGIQNSSLISTQKQSAPVPQHGVYTRFELEAFDTIEKNYWDKVSEDKLAHLFLLSLNKAASSTVYTLTSEDRTSLANLFDTVFATLPDDTSRKQLALQTLVVATYNIAPAGRNGLHSNEQETLFRNTVSNVDTSHNLYTDIGVASTAPISVIQKTYATQAKLLAHATSTEARARLQQLNYAKSVLTSPEHKQIYDLTGAEPTISSRIIGKTLYVRIGRMSPTTLQEFAYAVSSASTTPGMNSMIFDLRGNIGGSLQLLQGLLGLFIGKNQYAFDLYHQGDYQPQRTIFPKLEGISRYTDIALYTDAHTQSTAELTAATFKRFNIGHVVGVTSAGWGTVENTYPLTTVIDPQETYSLLLVNSITLDANGEAIQGNGIHPDVDITTKGWQNSLPTYFRSASLIQAIKETADKPAL